MSAQTYTLSSTPTFAEPVTLLVGLEDQSDGTLRAYLGQRSRGLYLKVEGLEEQHLFRRAWGTGGHIWMWPVPPLEALHAEKTEAES